MPLCLDQVNGVEDAFVLDTDRVVHMSAAQAAPDDEHAERINGVHRSLQRLDAPSFGVACEVAA